MKHKKRLHFVYSIPVSRFSHKKFLGEPLYRKNWRYVVSWPNPVSAPFSITYHILNYLQYYYQILLYDIYEEVSIELRDDDQFLGHMWPDNSTKVQGSNSWLTFDKNQVTNKVILKYPGDKRVFAISPFNHSLDQVGWTIPLLKKVNHFIGICGDFWYNEVGNTKFNFLLGKFSYLNMPINARQYPKVKERINKKGKRKFLYIGRISKEKKYCYVGTVSCQHQWI